MFVGFIVLIDSEVQKNEMDSDCALDLVVK